MSDFDLLSAYLVFVVAFVAVGVAALIVVRRRRRTTHGTEKKRGGRLFKRDAL